ncbi:MAG: methyltransferase domain-containing protein [Acidobacteriia bacterium]|nr:methyltransferase domain-containing protein [Terriglobia bacterium]
MTPTQAFNQEQRARWNGIDGEYWVNHQDSLDRTLAPVTGPLLAFAAPRAGSTVIDVGCGCGVTTIELARAVGPSGRVVAVDVSAPMLALAKERLRAFANTTCLFGDAAELPLRDLGAELIVSRFGVMFFGDPVAAFANLRTGLAPGGRLRFACWRPIGENPWLQIPLHAVYEHVPRLPKPDPEEPGPFSFSDTARVTRILTAAGFTAPSFTPLDVQMDIAAGGTLEDAVSQASAMGPTKRALADQPEDIRAAAIESIRRALTPHVSPDGVKFPGAIWLVAADSQS